MTVTTQGNLIITNRGRFTTNRSRYYKSGQLLQTGAKQLLLIRIFIVKYLNFLEENVIQNGCQGLLKNKEIRFFLFPHEAKFC